MSARPNWGSERPDLGSVGLIQGQGGGQKPETGENRPVWNHRSSAPSGAAAQKAG